MNAQAASTLREMTRDALAGVGNSAALYDGKKYVQMWRCRKEERSLIFYLRMPSSFQLPVGIWDGRFGPFTTTVEDVP